jgi:putative ABC transport system permease protein
MFSNFLKVTYRNLTRDKVFALINIMGLSVAIACCIVIGLYLNFQLGYDKHFDNHNRIYRVVHTSSTNGTSLYSSITSAALGPALLQDFPEVENAVRFRPFGGDAYFKYGNETFPWKQVFYADDTVFKMFSHEIIHGDPETALIEPDTIAISESMANSYFGDEDPLGKVLNLGTAQYRISLVFADLPENTHLKYDALLSYNGRPDATNASLDEISFFFVSTYTYVLMPENYDPNSFSAISQNIYDRYMQEFGTARGTKVNYVLEPLTWIHNHSPAVQGDQPHGNAFNIFAYGAVAVFVLLMACINYVNLATVRSSRQMKAISMRKILGANKIMLMTQYLFESLFFMLIAIVLGFSLAEMASAIFPLGQYLDIGSREFLSPAMNFPVVTLIVLLCLLVGLGAGAYPAFYLAAYSPLLVFAKAGKSAKKAFTLRSVLVVIQFTMTVVVVASTLLIVSQLQYLLDKPLGFDKDNKLVINVQSADVLERLPAFMQQLRQSPGVNGVFSTLSLPGAGVLLNLINIEDNEGVMQSEKFSQMYGDYNLVEGLGAVLVEGRGFDESRAVDEKGSVIVNEAAVKQMGWDEPLGKRFDNFQGRDAQVIGVVKDFHFNDLHSGIGPLAIVWNKPDYSGLSAAVRQIQSRKLVIDIADNNQLQTIDNIRKLWNGFTPDYPFEYRYLDDILNQTYSNEENLQDLLIIFSLLCIFVSCLGLYGLSAFITRLRTREISIRKVLGATVAQIISLLCRSIVPSVLVSAMLGSVIAFLLIRRWLESFYYAQLINPLAFLVASLLVLVVAITTIALQSNRTARQKPSLTLRVE